jgi:hypothetical protein
MHIRGLISPPARGPVYRGQRLLSQSGALRLTCHAGALFRPLITPLTSSFCAAARPQSRRDAEKIRPSVKALLTLLLFITTSRQVLHSRKDRPDSLQSGSKYLIMQLSEVAVYLR